MCEVQIIAGAGCQSGLFKLAVKHIQIISQLLILHRLWGWCLVLGDVPQTSPYWQRIVGWKLSSQLFRVVFFATLISFVSLFLAWLYKILSPPLYASSLPWQSCLSIPVSHGLSLLNEKNVLLGMHISSQKLTYEVTVSVSSSRSVTATSKTLQSVSWKQDCKSHSASFVHLLTILNTGLADFSFCL